MPRRAECGGNTELGVMDSVWWSQVYTHRENEQKLGRLKRGRELQRKELMFTNIKDHG